MDLDTVMAELDAAVGCADERGLEGLPGWVQPLGRAEGVDVPEEALRDALDDGPPRRRALAMSWLATARDLSDVPAFEARIDDDRIAGSFPSTVYTQQVHEHQPVDWQAWTLGEVALASLGRVTGQRFDSAKAWADWRDGLGRLEDSPEVWHGRVRGGEDPRVLVGLDPVVALRARLLDAPRYHGWSEAKVRQAWKLHVGSERTGRLLRREETWPEHRDPEDFGAFVVWALAEAHPGDLEALWEAGGPEPSWTRPALAAALGEASALVLMAPEQGLARVLRALGTMGPAARPHLVGLVRGAEIGPDDVDVVLALIDAARGVGVRVELPREDEARGPRVLKNGPAPTEAQVRAASEARADCVARIRAAL